MLYGNALLAANYAGIYAVRIESKSHFRRACVRLDGNCFILDSDVEFVLHLLMHSVTRARGTSLLSLLIREVNGEISLLKIPGIPRDACIRKGMQGKIYPKVTNDMISMS